MIKNNIVHINVALSLKLNVKKKTKKLLGSVKNNPNIMKKCKGNQGDVCMMNIFTFILKSEFSYTKFAQDEVHLNSKCFLWSDFFMSASETSWAGSSSDSASLLFLHFLASMYICVHPLGHRRLIKQLFLSLSGPKHAYLTPSIKKSSPWNVLQGNEQLAYIHHFYVKTGSCGQNL